VPVRLHAVTLQSAENGEAPSAVIRKRLPTK
jgi:hypothetical protein